jgi:hypothetical protein
LYIRLRAFLNFEWHTLTLAISENCTKSLFKR